MERYAIGEQDFKSLRDMGCVYVDKTQYIDRLLDSRGKYFFLARPRRFGKSLFLSTLQYFFEGRRELFKGLFIDTTDWNWESYPVLHLDLNVERYAEEGLLDSVMASLLSKWEKEYDISEKMESVSARFSEIISAAHRKTGKQVVILLDEYDKPLVSNLNNDRLFEHFRAKLSAIYSNFKSSAEHIRFVFMTGVSRFSKLSIFSDLNNINDISFTDEFAGVCGVSEEELRSYFKEGIKNLAEEYGETVEKLYSRLKQNYDGYRFSRNGCDIYNPWSLLNCFSKREIVNYWNMTGLPTIVAETLKRENYDLEDVLNVECDINRLSGLDLRSSDPIALLYQTGYLTIKHYDKDLELYKLGIPNREVKTGIYNVLLPYYVKVRRGDVDSVISDIVKFILLGKPDDMMKKLQAYFAGIPYNLEMDNEGNFRNAFYLLISLIGIKCEAESMTSDGRIDILLQTVKYVYVIELKYDGSATEALEQIERKRYARRFESDGRKIFKIGVNFSSRTRCIEDWIIKEN